MTGSSEALQATTSRMLPRGPAAVISMLVLLGPRSTRTSGAGRSESSGVQPVHQSALGYPTVRRAATIRGLVQAIDGDGVMGGRALEPAPPVGRLLRVDVPSRIDDQRRPASGNLDVEQVIMAVTAVAQRATVENEIAFFLERRGSRSPAAALDKVAAL